MNFALDDDQRMLKDSIERLAACDGGFEQRRQQTRSAEGFSRALWARYAEIGLLALPYPPAHGGLGGTPVDTMLVFESLARSLPLAPLLPTMVIGAAALRSAGDAQSMRWVPGIAAGETMLAWAHGEAGSRHCLHDVGCIAQREADGWRLRGAKAVFPASFRLKPGQTALARVGCAPGQRRASFSGTRVWLCRRAQLSASPPRQCPRK